MAGRLSGKLSFEADVTALTLTAYPLREWHHGARQLSLLDTPLPPRLAQLRTVVRVLQQHFGEAIVHLASSLGLPVPLPIQVSARSDGQPASLGWGRWSRRVTGLYEHWREQRAW